jgi:hypothetical protein
MSDSRVQPQTVVQRSLAHRTEFRELLYRFHPWSGFPIAIHEAINKPDGVVFRCDLVDSDSDRWLELPAWMFDRSACARVRLVATDPHADISALVALASLLRMCCTTP